MKSFKILSIFMLVAMLMAACSPAATPAATQTAALPATGPTTAATSAPANTAAATAGAATATASATATKGATENAPSSGTATPTATPSVTAPAGGTGGATATGAASGAVSGTATVSATGAATTSASTGPVPTIPPDALAQKNHLLICTDFPYPPQEFFDENGSPQGLDVEIGTEIAKRLGLQVQFVNSVFDTIIAAVKGGKCDIVISAQNITTDRQKQVSMIPYFQAGQAFVVQKGNPANIQNVTDLCGKRISAESGTTEADYVQGSGDLKGKGMPAECAKAGKPNPTLVVTQKDTDALQQLQTGKVDAYLADSPVAAYYTVQHPDQFQLAGSVVEPVMEGISVPCGSAADCTNAPLSPTGAAVKAALQSMMADGTYAKILAKWNLSSGAVKP